MAVTGVTLQYSGVSADNTKDRESYQEVYYVYIDAPVTDVSTILTAAGLPFYGKPYPGSATALCQTIRVAAHSETRTVYVVTANYESLDKQSQDQQKNDAGELTDNPSDWRDQVEWVPQKYTGPVENALYKGPEDMPDIRRIDDGGPCVNAAGDVYDPPPERDRSIRVLRITKFLPYFPVELANNYDLTINEDTFTITKQGLRFFVDKYKARFEPLQGALGYHQTRAGVEIPYWKVVIELALNHRGWRLKLLNQGINRRQLAGDTDDNGTVISTGDPDYDGYINTQKTTTRIKDRDRVDTDKPVLLDMRGQPYLSSTRPPIYLEYAAYPEMPFAPLNL